MRVWGLGLVSPKWLPYCPPNTDKMPPPTLFVKRIQQSTPFAAVTTPRASHIGPFILWYFLLFSLIALDTGSIRPLSLAIALYGTKRFINRSFDWISGRKFL